MWTLNWQNKKKKNLGGHIEGPPFSFALYSLLKEVRGSRDLIIVSILDAALKDISPLAT